MNALFQPRLSPDRARTRPVVPRHDARDLTEGGTQAVLDLDGTTYVLRITSAS